MSAADREYSPMRRIDGEESTAALEARIAHDAPAALAYLTRVGAEDLAPMLGIVA